MKKLNKWIAGLLCMMLVITMVAGLGVMEVKADDAVTTVSSWTELKNAISKGGNIQLGNDIVAETGNSAIYVSNTVTVDLAGHTIDRGCIKATWNGNTFTVSGGDLTIKDTSAAQAGKITGGYNDNNCGGGCIYVDSGILRLESGILTGNKCEDVDANGVDRGGAVGVRSGTFIMTGGKISNNEASYGAGVIVFSSGTFIMTGGEITDNTGDAGENGAGIYVYEGPSLTIGGNAKIYGNRTADGMNSNLSVGNGESSSTIINLSTDSPLTSEAKICIRVSTYSNGKQITTSCKDLKDVFVSDNDSYEITTKDGEEGIFYTKKKSSGGSSTPSTSTSYNLRVGGVEVTSANTSGKPSPTVAKYVEEDMMGRIDAIIDGGEVGIGLESTIIDLTVTPPQILRPGYITQEKLSTVLGTVDTDTTILRADSGQAPKAPGMKYRHYAPRGELTIVEGTPGQVREYINRAAAADHTAGEKTGIIGTEEMLSGYIADVVKSVGSRKDEDSIARHLYTILREFDDEGVTKIYSEGFSTEGFGQAIMNRLLKAAGHKVVKL